MPNRFTQVPDRPVPPLPGWVRPVVPLADLFMLLMVSRPRSGSLRRTWVTPATLAMCGGVAAGGAVVGAVLTAIGGSRGERLASCGGVALLLVAVGAAAVAVVGAAQRVSAGSG